ncbi:MAG: extracellular solute-binding protein [Anaerolineae bacterium]|nr:extracellular solute-binding protein [Anaerolineae bacterium]
MTLLLSTSACAPPPTQRTQPAKRSTPATAAITPPIVIEISAATLGLPPVQDETAREYAKASVLLQRDSALHFDVTIPREAEYTFAFDMAAAPTSVGRPEGQMRVDGNFPRSDFQRVIFPIYFRNSTNTFPKDRYGNDALIHQVRDVRWTKAEVRDVNFSEPYPLRVKLTAGTHRIDFTLTEGALYLGSSYVATFAPYPDYAQYLAAHTEPDASGFLSTLEAESPSYKNDTSARPNNNRSVTVTPYDTYLMLMNTLGGDSWKNSGSTVYYTVNVPTDGMYALTFRVLQNTRSNFTVFRRITINGKVPFEEFNAVPFGYTADWADVPLGGETPYKVFLQQGANELGIEVTDSPYLPAIKTIQQALLDINTLALEIRKLTGNQRDPYKEWVISNYIPDIQERLKTIAQHLIDDKDTLLSTNQGGSSAEVLTYQMAIDNVLFLAADPDKIPIYMGRFSEGTGSAAQLLGSLLPLLQEQPLAIDKIYVHSPDSVPVTPGVPFTASAVEDVKRFVHSFEPDPYQSLSADEGELEVWVNRARQYVDLLQLMADESFTPQTGIRVKFSIMPDESKLVLANAAGIQPDVALGVSTDRPYELAIRNALYDLRTFKDFDSFIHIYSPGALLGYIINDSVYALPETQDFWVTYYRKDILDSLGIPVPHTWNEVIEILPELQRYGMNFNTALSTGTGYKNYLATAPYLFNFGAQLYSNDGFATGLQSENAIAAVKFMADSFTIYGMPLTTASFYESFRYGTVPIGISSFETYVKLMTAAPELGGLWNIDLYPATVLPDGRQLRYATGSAQTSIMFKNTDKPEEGWQFLKWWMSTETQAEFQERLMLNYGREYLWSSANLEAFSRLDIPREHKAVILEQWKWLQEPVRLPGSYMQERELSNVWNRIVFDGVNPRVAIDRSVIIINREITRKMEEFGYLKDGQRVRDYKIPTIETVTEWMKNAK